MHGEFTSHLHGYEKHVVDSTHLDATQTAEGPVEIEVISGEVRHELVREMASRYLGDELGRQYADGYPHELDVGALVTLHPRCWRTELH